MIMIMRARSASPRMLIALMVLNVAWALFLTSHAEAQGSAGQNAICPTNSGCSSPVGSSAFIDASGTSPGTDICDTIHKILTTGYPPDGAVIDTRAITSNLVCGDSPWHSGTGYVNKPSTILLPAAAITIPNTWILPNGTRLVGENNQPIVFSTNSTVSTAILACTSSISGCTTNFSGAMIQFGDSHCPSSGCKGISVEDLTLNGNGLNITGIQNSSSKELTYVDHVTLYQILGTGLQISAGADNSGPYSNVTFDTGAYSPLFTSTACANINGTSGTRGIHGLSCIGEDANGQVGVYLDSSNNSIEDMRIMGFDDGIRVGSQAVARSNALLNIFGDTNQGSGAVINVIRISSASSGSMANVSDLSLMGVVNAGTNARTIEDDLTGTTLTDPSLGMYVLGRPKNNGYSRYTTSPNAATWVVGNPTNTSGPLGSCSIGSLYSNISGATPALWVCKPTTGWQSIR